MFNRWYHLYYLAQHFNQLLPGSSLGKAYTFQKNEIHIPVFGLVDYNQLHLSMQPPLPLLTLEYADNPPRNKVEILSEINGAIIDSVKIHQKDRQILIELDKGSRFLLIQFFGTAGNLFLLNENFEETASFKKRKGSDFPAYTDFSGTVEFSVTRDEFDQTFHEMQDRAVKHLLKQLPFPFYSELLIQECCQQAYLAETDKLNGLDIKTKIDLYNAYLNILKILTKPQFLLYSHTPPQFSLISLTFLENPDRFDNIIQQSNEYIHRFFRWHGFHSRKHSLVKSLERQIAILERKVSKQKIDLDKFPTQDLMREQADTLMAHLYQIPANSASVTLPRLTQPDESVKIPLNPKLSAIQNAQKLYEKAKSVNESKKQLETAWQTSSDNLQKLQIQFSQIQTAESLNDIRKIEKKIPAAAKAKQSDKPQERQPFIQIFFQGWEIRIGRSAKDNDILTHKLSKPQDFWLHARGVSGSHVTVVNPQKKEKLPKPVLETAAGLAAFYSKSKHASVVSVIFTQKKYVSKPRGSAPGMAACHQEDSIIVEPIKPADLRME